MKTSDFRLNIRFNFDYSLFSRGTLAALLALLRERMPAWSSKLHLYREETPKDTKDLVKVADVEETIFEIACQSGPLFHQLIKQYGGDTRRSGIAEIRGGDRSLIVVVSVDELAFRPSSGCWHWGNRITLQVCSPTLKSQDAVEWSKSFLHDACKTITPAYANAQLIEEYDEKNMTKEGTIMAVGLDISRYLPGLYWGNYFGEPYVQLIGREKLLSVNDLVDVHEVGNGVLMFLYDHPSEWEMEKGRSVAAAVESRVGKEFFFSKQDRDRVTRAPDFGLPELIRNPRFY